MRVFRTELPSGVYTGFDVSYITHNIYRWSDEPNWCGLAFGERIGFSTSGVADAVMEFDSAGAITNFTYSEGSRTAFDRANEPTDQEFPVEAMSWSLVKRMYR